MKTSEMLQAHPSDETDARLAQCIDACFECAQCCLTCADACLAEDMTEKLVQCIRTDLDCADLCEALGRVLSRRTSWSHDTARAQLEACITACRCCAEECDQHASKHEHCRICAECCRRCEQSCRTLLGPV